MVATFARKSGYVKTPAQARATIAKAIRKRRTNNPVKRVYKGKRPTTNVNKTAIMRLSRQVKQLQMARYGFKQWQHQNGTALDPLDPNYTSPTFHITQGTPLCFCVNDFYAYSKIFQGGATLTNPPVPTYSEVGEFRVMSQNPPGMFSTDYNWNLNQSAETVSTIHYLPIKSTINIHMKSTSGPNLGPIRVRVTLFKVKSADQALVKTRLPDNLGAYRNLVSASPLDRNYFNTHSHHTVLYDKYAYYGQTDVTKYEQEKHVKIVHQFDGKSPVNYEQFYTPHSQRFYRNIPQRELIWCLISTDTTDGTRMSVSLDRWNTWRDQHDVGS